MPIRLLPEWIESIMPLIQPASNDSVRRRRPKAELRVDLKQPFQWTFGKNVA